LQATTESLECTNPGFVQFLQTDGNNTASSLMVGAVGEAQISATYQLSGPGRLVVTGNEYISYAEFTTGLFVHSDGNNSVGGSLYLGYDYPFGDSFDNWENGTYQLSGTGRLWAASEYLAMYGTGIFQQSGGQNTTGYLSLYARGLYTLRGGTLTINGRVDSNGVLDMSTGSGVLAISGAINMRGMGEFDLGGGTLSSIDPNLYVHIQSDGNFHVTSGIHRVDSVMPRDGNILKGATRVDAGAALIAARIMQQTLSLGGSLTVGQLYVGGSSAGGLSITDANAIVTVSSLLSIGSKGSLSAVSGSVIHMTGSTFQNQNTDANVLSGMANLRLIYEGADATCDPFEVAGRDIGADANGFTKNFGLGALQLGSDSGPGRVILEDQFDNQPSFSGAEALYVQSLTVNPGSELCLNGLHLYVNGALVDPGDGALYGGGTIEANVPEPGMLTLLAASALGLLRRRTRR
jgi:hypothetical protein